MIITKKALPRRTFLRGVRATLALPLLDAMFPPMTAAGRRRRPTRSRRLGLRLHADGVRHHPLDAAGRGHARRAVADPQLAGAGEGARHGRSRNLELQNAYPGTHATSNAAFLSAARAKHTESTDYYLGTTVDQIAAKQIGQETQLPSLELAMDLLAIVGQCDNGYACVYSEQPLVVVADDAAAGRGPPADRVRAPLRRGRQRRRAAAPRCEAGPACSIR